MQNVFTCLFSKLVRARIHSFVTTGKTLEINSTLSVKLMQCSPLKIQLSDLLCLDGVQQIYLYENTPLKW